MTEEEYNERIAELESERDQMRQERDQANEELARIQGEGNSMAERIKEAAEARRAVRTAERPSIIRGYENTRRQQSVIRGLEQETEE